MKLWQLYFAVKLYLYFRGYLQFDGLLNLLLFLYWLLPTWADLYRIPRSDLFNRVHGPIGGLACLVLLWHDTYFPPVTALMAFLVDPSTRPTFAYIAQFLAGYWNGPEFAMLLGLIILFKFVSHRTKISLTLPLLGAVLVPSMISYATKPPPLNQVEKEFYSAQSKVKTKIHLEQLPQGAVDFDIILLQVCSMAWEDLTVAGLTQHPFLKNFDVVFSQFNTVTSYSTPAALRLLRAPCGQVQHPSLYQETDSDCYLAEQLRAQNYDFDVLFNHDGTSSETMGRDLQRLAKTPLPLSVQHLKPEAVNYDGSAMLNNREVLADWWSKRVQSNSRRAALYYNTVSLHGGAHFNRDADWWKQDRVSHYHEAANQLFADLDSFMKTLQSSGKNVLVVMVSEHGAALKGNSVQAQDLRDIPLPGLTTVPLAVRWISAGQEGPVSPVVINKAVSYRVIPELIQFVAQHSRVPAGAELENSLEALPYFGENQHAVTTIQNKRLYFKNRGAPWKPLPQTLIPSDSSLPPEQNHEITAIKSRATQSH